MVLKNNDIIFCSSSYLEILFYYLNKVKKVANITLVTGQSDRPINQRIYNKKPDCISSWYSVNIDYKHPDLFALPLGLANDYSPKNVSIDKMIKFDLKKVEKKNKLYVNIQKNTNHKERSDLEILLKNKEWVEFKEPTLKLNQYLLDLHTYDFVLCPWGNGIDTHRLWETLYSGSIPVTKYHNTYESLKNLPVIFVEDYIDLNIEMLNVKKDKLQNKEYEILDMDFWKKKIIVKKNTDTDVFEEIKEKKIFEFYYWNKLKIKSFIKNRYKVIKFYLEKISGLFYKN